MGLANSETGVLTPPPDKVDGQYPFGRARADWLMLDVTQAVGRLPFSFSWSGADLAILSAHKLGGPKGVGALLVEQGLDIPSLSEGGGQEMGRRSGTENVIGIAGFGAAAEAAARDLAAGVWDRVAELRNILEKTIEAEAETTIFVGNESPRLPNTACFATPGWKGETQVMQMDLAGFAISAGSACSSGKIRESRVLRAMGYDAETARSAIRVSLGPQTTEDEVSRFCEAWLEAYRRHRQRAA
jgi:cysteine desulfurase